jgi:hypothetical protein
MLYRNRRGSMCNTSPPTLILIFAGAAAMITLAFSITFANENMCRVFVHKIRIYADMWL